MRTPPGDGDMPWRFRERVEEGKRSNMRKPLPMRPTWQNRWGNLNRQNGMVELFSTNEQIFLNVTSVVEGKGDQIYRSNHRRKM